MSGPPARSKGWGGWTLPQAAAILLAGVWAYWPAVHGTWLWDDGLEVAQNPLLRDPAGWWKAWVEPAGLDYFPLKDSVQWLQWHLWGPRPFGYHLTNVGLHLLGALLLWRLLSRLGVRLGWVGGLLFAVHPLAVESVAWISELKNTLSLPLVLLAMICYVEFDRLRAGGARCPQRADSASVVAQRVGDNALHLWSLGLFLLAMLCKSSVVMFPAVLLLYVWWRRGRISWADVRASAPFWAISLALGLVTIWFQQHRAIGGGAAAQGFLPRVAGAGRAVVFYFAKCAFPTGLAAIYPRWSLNRPSGAQFLPWCLMGAVLLWLWRRRATSGRHALFGLGWFLLNLVPVLGFVPMAYERNSWVADHFAYVSLAGVAGLAAALASRAWVAIAASPPAGRSLWRMLGVIFLAAVAATLAFESHGYAGVFASEEALWAQTLQRNADAWLAHNELGKLALERGAVAEALGELTAARTLEPDSGEVRANLGNALLRAGRTSAAFEQYQEAVRLDPALAGARYDWGTALLQTGRPAEAIDQFQAAVRLDPGYAAAHNNWGLALARTGRLSEAVSHYQAALRLNPDFPEACVNLGNAFFNLERLPEAVAQYRQALRINPRYAAAHRNLGYAWRALGRADEARAEFQAAGLP